MSVKVRSKAKAKRKPIAKAKAKTPKGKTLAGVSDAAVQAKTGKTWRQWITVLDRAKAYEWKHRNIAIHLRTNLRVGDWWSQMVTVGYEQAKGLRAQNQRSGGFATSASRSFAAPVGALFDAWTNESTRRQWLGGPAITIRRVTRTKSMRIAWEDGSSVNVSFSSKGPKKSQVAIDHEKLASTTDVARKKEIWRTALGRLKTVLER